jgi:hypothetical protein
MPPKRGRPAAPPKGKTAQQSQLEQMPLIKKPLGLIGNSINVPRARSGKDLPFGPWMADGQMTRSCVVARASPA